jgi:CBS domain-containing protein
MLTPDLVTSDLWGFFNAKHIATDLKDAATVDQDEPGIAAYERLHPQRFRHAPVVSHGRIVGWVLTAQLPEAYAVGSVMTPLDRSAIVSAESGIPNVLRLLGRENFVFTADADGIAGFIVPSDLDRHSVRSYFYLLVAGIEMLLSEIVKYTVPEEKIIAALRDKQKDRYTQAHGKDSEAHPVEYIYFSGLVSLFMRTSYSKDRSIWDSASTRRLSELEEFRNSVMHPACSIAATVSPVRAAELASAAEDLAERLRKLALDLSGVAALPRPGTGPRIGPI